jgi:hypothetical protein
VRKQVIGYCVTQITKRTQKLLNKSSKLLRILPFLCTTTATPETAFYSEEAQYILYQHTLSLWSRVRNDKLLVVKPFKFLTP